MSNQISAQPTGGSSNPLSPTPSASYLNNDGIDQLTPAPRRKRVSSLSLSDQWASASGLHSMTKLSDELPRGLPKSSSRLSMGSDVVRYKKKVIDHARVASYAFAFDIDGVIVKGPDTIPEAKEAIRMLNGENPYKIKVPFIFVTNGGGRAEKARSQDLSRRLDAEITEDQIIQGHTPMKDLVNVYKNVLVVGGVGDACRKVAESYGFKNVYIPLDVMYWNPSVSPYYTLTEEDKEVCKKDVDFSKIKIDGILVFADSRNWAADQQIILELLLSKQGYMGTISETFEEGPAIYFAHSDFVWATNYKLSRYGMGALQVSIAALYREHTGKELRVTRFGKPQRGTFKYAAKVLSNWRKDVLEEHFSEIKSQATGSEKGSDDEDDEEEGEGLSFATKQKNVPVRPPLNRRLTAQEEAAQNKAVFADTDNEDEEESDDEGLTLQKLSQLTLDLPPASTVYFVGDTPESDIRFANSHDESWHSILVKTGVYQGGTIPKYQPKHICENVLEAVKYALNREHEMELNEWNANAEDDPALAQNTVDVPVVLEETIIKK